VKNSRKLCATSAIALLSAVISLAGCGGGGGGGGTSGSTTGTLSGTAAKGQVSGGTVTAFGIDANGTRGTRIGSAKTDAQGNFLMYVGNYSGAIMLQLAGGNYTDEATDQTMNMYQNTVMTAVIPNMMTGDTIRNIEITPLTSMAQARAQTMSGGMTQANINLANGAMGQFFDIGDILTTRPMNPLVEGSGAGATQDQRNYGMALAGMSQEAYQLPMPNSSGIVTAMMDDASDGKMDGMMAEAIYPWVAWAA
jgi:hypothetical protein